MTQNGNRTLELPPQDWALIRSALIREASRWPTGHVQHFNLLRLHYAVAGVCQQKSPYKTVRRNG